MGADGMLGLFHASMQVYRSAWGTGDQHRRVHTYLALFGTPSPPCWQEEFLGTG